jgi:hypothetical protein
MNIKFLAKGQQRWWIDAFLSVIESDPHWKSEGHKFGQSCLTRGFPKSSDYERGLIFDRDYQQAWDCSGFCDDSTFLPEAILLNILRYKNDTIWHKSALIFIKHATPKTPSGDNCI